MLDNHGSGNPENVLGDALPPGSRLETWNVFELARAPGRRDAPGSATTPRAGVPAFISHTYVPGLRLRVDGELIGESHGRAWRPGVPLLGIVGNDAHGANARLARRGAVPGGAADEHADRASRPCSKRQAPRRRSPRSRARRSAPARPCPRRRPASCSRPSLPADEEQAAHLAASGWQQRTATEFAVELRAWSEAAEPARGGDGRCHRPLAAGFHELRPHLARGVGRRTRRAVCSGGARAEFRRVARNPAARVARRLKSTARSA